MGAVENQAGASAEERGLGLSLLQRAASERKQRGPSRLELVLPGWDGRIGARYKIIEREDWADVSVASAVPDEGDLADLDLIARTCETILAKDDDGKWVPVDIDGEPLLYDERLAQILDIPASGSRAVILAVFDSNARAIEEHAARILAWLRDPSGNAKSTLTADPTPAPAT